MRIISHRGNLQGSEKERENSLPYIQRALDAGFDVEVDLRIRDHNQIQQLFFGHDEPQYPVSFEWLGQRKDRLILHVKEFWALKIVFPDWHYICHTSDPFTITSKGFLWLHDLKHEPDANTIIPLIKLDALRDYMPLFLKGCHGICTDYPIECAKILWEAVL